MRRAFRLIGFVGAILLTAVDLFFRKPRCLTERAAWMQHSSVQLLRFLGIAVDVRNMPAHPGALVCNHLSYLDILVLGAQCPFVFVAKAETRSWPLIGRLIAATGAIFIERESARSTQSVTQQIADTLREGVSVIFFPEGTTSDGQGVLPFRSSLFQPLVESGVPVWPAHLSYTLPPEEGGATMVRQRVCYWGDMVFGPHVVRFLGLRGLRARVQCGNNPIVATDRKDAARRAYASVCELAAVSGKSDEPALVQETEDLLDRPVERLRSVDDERCVPA